MAKSRKPRKAYKGRDVILNPMQVARANVMPLDDHGQALIKIKQSQAISNICQGEGTREDWDVIAGTCNVAILVSEAYFEKQYQDEIQAAKDAIICVKQRYKVHNRLGFKGDELKAINKLILIAEEQAKQITRKEYSRILDSLHNMRFAA